MPLQARILKKCIDQVKELDSDAAVNELTETELRNILGVLTEAVNAFTSLKNRLSLGIASDIYDEADAEKQFRQKLIDEGFLAKPKDPSYKPAGDRTPIKVKGKPVSEMIIEERR